MHPNPASQANREHPVNIERRYIVDENNRKIAVQLDIETFEKIETILENQALYQCNAGSRR